MFFKIFHKDFIHRFNNYFLHGFFLDFLHRKVIKRQKLSSVKPDENASCSMTVATLGGAATESNNIFKFPMSPVDNVFATFYDKSSKTFNCEERICSAFEPFIEEEFNLIPSAEMVHQNVDMIPRQGAAYICSDGTGEETLAGITISEPLSKSELHYIGELKHLRTAF